MRDPFAVIADRDGISREEVLRSVQEYIDSAWGTSQGREAMFRITGCNQKPTPIVFVLSAASKIIF